MNIIIVLIGCVIVLSSVIIVLGMNSIVLTRCGSGRSLCCFTIVRTIVVPFIYH